MTKHNEQYFKTNYTNNYNYSTFGGQISELGTVISQLEATKDLWDESVYSNEPFYNSFISDMETLITHLNTYKSYLETKGADIQKLAEWTD